MPGKTRLRVMAAVGEAIQEHSIEIPRELFLGVDPHMLQEAVLRLYNLMPDVEVISITKLELIPSELCIDYPVRRHDDLNQAKELLKKFQVVK